MFFLLLCSLSIAQAQESVPEGVDYIEITEGTPAPFSGRLFTDEALAKMFALHQTEISELTVNHEYVLRKQELDLNLKYDLLNSKYNSEIVMYQRMIDIRDEQLKKSAKKDIWQKWATYGGFVLGAATSVAIFYSVNTN